MKLHFISLSLLGAALTVVLTAAPAERSDATLTRPESGALAPGGALSSLNSPTPTPPGNQEEVPEATPVSDNESTDAEKVVAMAHGDDSIAPLTCGNGIIKGVAEVSARFQPILPQNAIISPETVTEDGIVEGTVARGDTISGVLEQASSGAVQHYVNAARQVFPLRSFREGQPYIVFTEPESGALTRFEYEINDQRRLVIEGLDAPQARLEPIEYVTTLCAVEGTINDNLFQTVADIGENPQLALKLVELFGSEINFIRDLQEGDSFSVLIEKRYRAGEYKGYGRILAATFSNRQKTYHAYLFGDGSSPAAYYNQKGESLTRTLLQAPLSVTRLTSRFSQSRKHPILGKSRPHLGVDYGAPTGTPVKSVGDGVVTKKGWAGGFGNQIIVKHDAGLESMYAHLSGFARGLKPGQKVRQGQVIGFVGSTGLSTGPHLDFRIRQNGQYIDPSKAINPRAPSVPQAKMTAFQKVVAREKTYLEGARLPAPYRPDSIVPTDFTPAKTLASAEKQAGGNTRKKSKKK